MNQLLTRPSEPLPAFLFDQEIEQPESEGFHIDSEDKASWAANKILGAEHRIQLREELAERYKARIDDWLSTANQSDIDSMAYLKSLLKGWLAAAILFQPKIRSIKVLGATIGFRKKPDRVEINDPNLALEFCEVQLPEAIVVKKELSKTALKTSLASGQHIPGTFLFEGESELYVKGSV